MHESLMLTGDENIVDVNFEVQWKIRNAADYLFNVENRIETIKSVAESAMREVIGRNSVATVISEGDGKLRIEMEVRRIVQSMLDQYKAGIEVTKINMLKAEPPEAVIEAFRDVQRAQTDQERLRNEAETYRNDILPRARGQAAQILQDAEAYREQAIAKAEGEAGRFLAVYKAYAKAKNVTKKRMYLETMEQILRGMDKIIIDPTSANGVVPYLPLPEIQKRRQTQP